MIKHIVFDLTGTLTTADPTIKPTLEKLRERMPISLFTNYSAEAAFDMLDSIGIDKETFTHILTSNLVKAPKPALDGFHKLIELTGLLAEETLYVGDRLDTDILPAKQAGLKTCLVRQNSPEADYRIEYFDQLLKIDAI